MLEPLFSRNAKYFLTCFELRSFSRTAKELRVSQSTLSLAIQSLEAQLGQKLFHRGRGQADLQATPYAKKLATELKRIRKELEQRISEIDTPRAVRIASVQYFARTSLLPALRSLELFEDTKVFVVRTAKALEAIKKQEIDVAFVLAQSPPMAKKELCFPIRTERIGVVGEKSKFSHILKARFLDELRDEPWIVGDKVYENWPASLDSRKNSFYIEDHFSARFLVLEGYGIAQLQLDYFSDDELDRLAISRVRLPFHGMKLYAVFRNNLPEDIEKKLLELVKHLKYAVSK